MKSVNEIAHDRVLYCSTCMGGNVVEQVLLEINELPPSTRKRLEELKKTGSDILTIVGFCPVCKRYTVMMAAEV
jgi:hypothetical protein